MIRFTLRSASRRPARQARGAGLAVLLCLAAGLAASAGPAAAASLRFDLLLDTDDNTVTGCLAPEPAGSVAGIEQKFSIEVTTTASAATVTRITRQACSGGLLGTETVADAGGWAVGIGNGSNGTAAIEAAIARSWLPTRGSMRVTAASSANGQGDLAPSFLVDLGNDGGGGGGASPASASGVPVPLARAWLVPLALMVGWLGWRFARRIPPGRTGLWILFALLACGTTLGFAAVVLDGNVGDWSGIAPRVADAQGDAPPGTDIVAVFEQAEDTRFDFRIDAVIAFDTPANKAPVVSAGPDLAVVLPATATLNGSASDDGLPNPPGALTLAWSTVSGPARSLSATHRARSPPRRSARPVPMPCGSPRTTARCPAPATRR